MEKFVFVVLAFFSFQVNATQSAIASAHPLATEAGIKILAEGGNAFDAAITVSAVLAVVEPYSSGIGGGGFWLLHQQKNDRQIMIDGREMAPSSAHRDMYLDKHGEPVPQLSLNGALAAGIPGQIAALDHLAEHYGNLPLSKTLAPAIKIAKNGFTVTEHYQKMTKFRLDVLRKYPSSALIFLKDGQVPDLGDKIIQKDLAETLRAVAEQGRAGFYQGDVGVMLVSGVQAARGIWKTDDLRKYKVIERKPIRGNYLGIKITSAAPPSSGGMVMMQALKILQQKDFAHRDEITKKHLLIEAMRRAYQDRSIYLGDPDFVTIPMSITSNAYAAVKGASINLNKATPSESLAKKKISLRSQATDTTHFSILDTEGNRVSATLSINYPFGSGFVVPGTGVLLNDEMDDFSIRTKTPNAYGLIGGEANEIAPGKRPLSSMTPTFLESTDKIAILGTPGGSRIISMVLLAVLDFAEGNAVDSWVSIPRFHHQFMPDKVQFELDGLTKEEQNLLKKKGHQLKELTRQYGNMQAILIDRHSGDVTAASDPRGEGSAQVVEVKEKTK